MGWRGVEGLLQVMMWPSGGQNYRSFTEFIGLNVFLGWQFMNSGLYLNWVYLCLFVIFWLLTVYFIAFWCRLICSENLSLAVLANINISFPNFHKHNSVLECLVSIILTNDILTVLYFLQHNSSCVNRLVLTAAAVVRFSVYMWVGGRVFCLFWGGGHWGYEGVSWGPQTHTGQRCTITSPSSVITQGVCPDRIA